MELGGNIQLTGFDQLETAELIVVKKIVGNYARKFSEMCKLEGLHVTFKPVHKTKGSEKFEIHAQVQDSGKNYNSELTDRNLFVVLDSVLKNVEKQIKK